MLSLGLNGVTWSV